jgi:hypothetical protein
VVVAGTEAGIVRVGVGVLLGSSEAVLGVMPSGLMGAFLWIGIGGIVSMCRCEVVPLVCDAFLVSAQQYLEDVECQFCAGPQGKEV